MTMMAPVRVLFIFFCVAIGVAARSPWIDRALRDDHLKIVGGKEIAPYSWPFLVQLSRGGSDEIQDIFCGGAVISSTFILTAAHCLKGFENDVDSFRVTASEHDITKTEGVEQRRKIAKMILHPQYNGGSMENDVALLKLDSPLDLSSDKVKVIGLNTAGSCPADSQVCRVAGWGALESGGGTPDKPHEVKVTVVSNQQCNSPSAYNGGIFDTNVCAGETQGGKDSCQGDSGGPFVCTCGSQLVHVGVVSWGEGCALAGKPGVYARTSSYVPWINKCLTSNGDDCEGVDGGNGGGGNGGGDGGSGGDGGDGETTPAFAY